MEWKSLCIELSVQAAKKLQKKYPKVKIGMKTRELLLRAIYKIQINEGESLEFEFKIKEDAAGIIPIPIRIPKTADDKLNLISKYVFMSKRQIAKYLVEKEISTIGKERKE